MSVIVEGWGMGDPYAVIPVKERIGVPNVLGSRLSDMVGVG